MIVLDTETTGLDCRTDRLTTVGVAFDDADPLVLRHPQDRDLIQRVLALDEQFVAHNAPFDFGFLESAGYAIPEPDRWVDTTLVAHTAGARRPGQTRLDALQRELVAAGELPAAILEPEQQIKAWLRRARAAARKAGARRPEKGDAPPGVVDPYLRADVASTRAVARHYRPRADEQASIVALEHACLPAVYAAERRGVPLDLAAAAELRDRTAVNVVELRERVFELAGRRFALGSAKQLDEIFRGRGVDTSALPKTPTTAAPSFSHQALETLDDDLARALLAFRDERKLADYVTGLYEHAHGDRLYGTFNQCGTDTGRMSSSRPNLQNIPKSDLRVRYVIKAAPGRVLVGADQDNVELRVLACYAPGGALERAFASGVDLHQQTADALGVDRDVGKTVNYAILYGAGVPRISAQLRIGRDEAKEILDRWHRTYPEVTRLKARLTRTVRRRGYLLSIGGRRHYFEQPNHMLLNRLISGSCADLFKRSLIELHRAGVPMILFVHDEVVAEVPEDDAERVARLLETELARGSSRPGVVIDGLVATATIAKRWSDFKQPGYTPEVEPAPPARGPEQLPLEEASAA